MIAALINHLWQSTLFALGAGLLTLALKTNGARFRYGVWFAASVKFLIPFALLGSAGGWVVTQLHPTTAAPAGLQVVRQVVEPFASAPSARPTSPPIAPPIAPMAAAIVPIGPPSASPPLPPLILAAVWAVGVAFVLALWTVRWRRVRAALIASSPLILDPRVAARASPSLFEPGVVGVFRQVLMFPIGIETQLSAAELEAVLAHELCHLRRRDNLTAAIHMLVEALFWFHPLVWWIGGRLILERERACDEGVISAGHDPRVYAEGILKVCRFYLRAPLACAAGISGSNLKTRVERIMTGCAGARLSLRKTALMWASAVLAVFAPLAAGLIAALPATARTAILEATGPQSPAPSAPAADAPTAAPDDGDRAPAVDADLRRERTIAQSLKQGAAIVAAPGEALAAAIHIDPVATPKVQLAALTAPESAPDPALIGGGAQMTPAPAPPPAGCRLPALATFRVAPRSYLPLVDGEINGRMVQFVAAVSSRTAIFRSAAKDLSVFEESGRKRDTYTPEYMEIGYGWVHDLELDDMPRKVLSSYDVHEDFRIAMEDGGAPSSAGAVLGIQF